VHDTLASTTTTTRERTGVQAEMEVEYHPKEKYIQSASWIRVTRGMIKQLLPAQSCWTLWQTAHDEFGDKSGSLRDCRRIARERNIEHFAKPHGDIVLTQAAPTEAHKMRSNQK